MNLKFKENKKILTLDQYNESKKTTDNFFNELFDNIFKNLNELQKKVFIENNFNKIINFFEKLNKTLINSNPLLYEIDYKKIVENIVKDFINLKKDIDFPKLKIYDEDKIIANYHLKQCWYDGSNHNNVKECPFGKPIKINKGN